MIGEVLNPPVVGLALLVLMGLIGFAVELDRRLSQRAR